MKRLIILGIGAAVVLTGCQDLRDPLGPVAPQPPELSTGAAATWAVTTLEDSDRGVCAAGRCSLREAIAAANLAGGLHRITFKNRVAGVIALESALPVFAADITIDGPGAGAIQIDAGGFTSPHDRLGQIVNVAAGSTVSVNGLTLRRGSSLIAGGAVHNQGILTLSEVIVADSDAGSLGGGISNSGGDLTVVRSVISGNSATDGGGIWNSGVMRVIQSTIEGNAASSTQVAGGGGIYNRGSATILQSTIAGNVSAHTGGGIFNSQAFQDSPPGRILVQRSTISGNRAGTGQLADSGGGITNLGALELVSSTITGNEAISTFADFSGSGLNNRNGTVLVRNTIIAGNRNKTVGLDDDCLNIDIFGAVLTSLGHNLTASGNCAFTQASDVAVLPSQVFSVVLTASLAENGGPTQTHALIERGFAVDAGYCPGELEDQRGLSRPFDDLRMPNALDGCDIGAFEWQPASSTDGGGERGGGNGGGNRGGRGPNR